MNTIEDNAYNYATTKCRCSRCSGYDHMGMRVCNKSEDKTCERFRSLREGYIDGATEQRKIDIEKACEWLDNYLMEIGYPDDWMRDSLNIKSGKERFRKAMEE